MFTVTFDGPTRHGFAAHEVHEDAMYTNYMNCMKYRFHVLRAFVYFV
jgi:hypothetical protein